MDLFLSNRWLPMLATLGAVALSLYLGMANLMDVRSIQEGASSPSATSGKTPSENPAGASRPDLAKLANWHLFGGKKQETVSSQPKPVIQRTEAPITRLKLKLQGIFSPTVEGQEGWAIIEAPGENPKAYRIGDEVPGGAQLSAVEVDQIIITRNGRPESLPLEMEGVTMKSDNPQGEMEEITPMERPPQRPRTQARARAPSTTAPSPELAEPPMETFPPMEEPDTSAPPYLEPEEPVVHSPAIEAAEQDLVEEMKRLRESFKKQQQ